MSTNVVMPQMGESIAEGTVVRWIKKVGDPVDKDEPLFEISTDKVDAEIPSPGSGVVVEIKVKEGETVPVNSVVAVIAPAGTKVSEATIAATEPDGSVVPAAPGAPAVPGAPGVPVAPGAPGVPAAPGAPDLASLRRTRSSPLVRNIAKKHGIDIAALSGSGISGRVTKKDILAFIERGGTSRPAVANAAAPAVPAFAPGESVRIEKMGVMRRKIAEHMLASVRTSPHVYSAYEVDFFKIDQIRAKKRGEYEKAGTKLTYTAFIAKATVETIREFPFANASLDGDNIVYKKDVNLGIAVALDQGLIVPVIHKADERSMLGLCRAIQDLAQRARSKQLKTDEVQGGTFTITNPGIFGAVFGLPILSQPQVAILGVGSVDKRVVVIDDMIAIRPICHLTLGFDHRLIDGADAGRFLHRLKDRLQNFDEAWV